MKSTLRRTVEEYLRAEGRLDLRKLGPAETPTPREVSFTSATTLRGSLTHSRAFQVRIQWICVGLLCLVFFLQSMFVAQGLLADSARTALMGSLGIVLLPVIWVLRRIWIDSVVTKLIQDAIHDLPAEDAVTVIEMIYRALILPGTQPQPRTAPPASGPGPKDVRRTTILFITSDPTDATRLRLGKELREIQERLEAARLRDRFLLQQRFAVRQTDLIQALLNTRPEIVHFSGHGLADGALCLEDEHGLTQRVTPVALSKLFQEFPQIRCVLLNACYTEGQAEAISQHIEFVIGVHGTIPDEAAILFATGFYQGLGAGRSIRQAYRLGCTQMNFKYPDQPQPVLIPRER